MDKYLLKETKRKLAGILACILVFTIVFNNFIWTRATEVDNRVKIYEDDLRALRIVDEEDASVSGGDITIGGKTFPINGVGGIEVNDSDVTGGDASGGDASGGDASGGDSSGGNAFRGTYSGSRPGSYILVDNYDYEINVPGYVKVSGEFENGEVPEEIIISKKFVVQVDTTRTVSSGDIPLENADIILTIQKDGAEDEKEITATTDQEGKVTVILEGKGEYEIAAEWKGIKVSSGSISVKNDNAGEEHSIVNNSFAFELKETVILNFKGLKIDVTDNTSSLPEGVAEPRVEFTVSGNDSGNLYDECTGDYDIMPNSTVTLTISPPTDYFVFGVKMGGGTQWTALEYSEENKNVYQFEVEEADVQIKVFYGKIYAGAQNGWKILVTNENVTEVVAGEPDGYELSVEKIAEDPSYEDYEEYGSFGIEWKVEDNEYVSIISIAEDNYMGIEDSVNMYVRSYAYLVNKGKVTITCDIVAMNTNGQVVDTQPLSQEIDILPPQLEYGEDGDVYFIVENGKELGEFTKDKFSRIKGISFPQSKKEMTHYKISSLNSESEDWEDLDDEMGVTIDGIPDGVYSLSLYSVSSGDSDLIAVTENLEIWVDNTEPKIVNLWWEDAEEAEVNDLLNGEKKVATNKSLMLVVEVEETNSYTVEIVRVNKAGQKERAPVSLSALLGEGSTIYAHEIKDDTLINMVQYWKFVITDEAGNVTESEVIEVIIDKVVPDSTVYICYDGDVDNFYSDEDELVERNDKSYVFGSLEGTLYNNNEVQLGIFVRDDLPEDASNGISSGIGAVEVTYAYTMGSNWTEKSEEHKETIIIQEFDGEEDENVEEDAEYVIDGKTYDKIVINLSVEDGWKITSIDAIILYDKAGNQSAASFELITEDQLDYVIDNTAPSIYVIIPDNHSEYSEDEGTYYYRQWDVNSSINVKITEDNFFKKDIEAGTTLKTVGATAETVTGNYIYDESSGGKNVYNSKFDIGWEDGIYQFAIAYTDRSGNKMKWEDDDGNNDNPVINGVYTSPFLVMDETKPELNISFFKDEKDAGTGIDDNYYFDSNVKMEISIKEVNFDPTLVTMKFHAKDVEGVEVDWDSYDSENLADVGEWEMEEGIYKYIIDCKKEWHYKITVECIDKAGNYNEVEQEFTIDKTAPEIVGLGWQDAEGNEYQIPDEEGVTIVTSGELSLIVKVKEANGYKVKFESSREIYEVTCDVAKTSSDDEDTHIYKISVPEGATTNRFWQFIITDDAGNKRESYDIRVIIDRDAPILVQDKIVKTPGVEWHSKNVRKDSIVLTFSIHDYADIKSIQLVSEEEKYTIGEECIIKSADRDSDGYYTYTIATKADMFSKAQDQKLDYQLVLEDEYGNGNEKTTDGSVNIGIDNTAPSNTVYVRFTGDKDKFYDGSGIYAEAVNDYVYGSQNGTLYNKDKVQLEVFVQDLPAPDAIAAAASGIVGMEVVYTYTDSTNRTQKDKSNMLQFRADGETVTIEKDAATINGNKYDRVVFSFEVAVGQKITSIQSVYLLDVAGNSNTATYQSITKDQIDYVIDDISPTIAVDIPAGSSGYSKDANTYYYNRAIESIAVNIAENNFFAADVGTTLQTNAATRAAEMGSYQFTGANIYRNNFALKQGDGIYQFAINYTDRSENQLVRAEGSNASVANGVYTSPLMIVDMTHPVLDIRYYMGGKDVTSEIYSGKCFGDDITAVISITEVNFDPDLVELTFHSQTADSNTAVGHSYNKDGWSRSGNTYHYSINCNTEGRYQISASSKDKAGNSSNGVAISNFIVDKTAPSIDIKYNVTTDNDYYNVDRVATVSVREKNFNADKAEYLITSDGAQPTISQWSHAGGNGCNDSSHVNGCVWTSLVTFSQDDDYSFSLNCTDEAGNKGETPAVEEFTIDMTNPVITVTYDNNLSANERYYNTPREASIVIDEHNFSQEGINIQIGTPDGQANNHSGWRNIGGDSYAATIMYNTDGDYTFNITCEDMAGNMADVYQGDNFVIDLTAPELEIIDVQDRSANNGVVTPTVTYSDKNYSVNDVTIRITGVNSGEVDPENEVTNTENGQSIHYMDFSHTAEMDDLYTLTATVADKAGNETEESIMFSVNRFGSVYILGQDAQDAISQFYINYGPTLTITEINVDTLEHKDITYSLDSNIVKLEEGKDYTVNEKGGEFEWKEYTYIINSDNFEQEGLYVITIQSEDRASNDTNNRLKEKNIEFLLDKTPPTVVMGGVEDNESYREESRIITIDASDNIYLKNVEVYVSDALYTSFDEDAITQANGVVTLEVMGAQKWQTMYIVANDAAGNEATTVPIRFLISANLFVLWINNIPLVIGTFTAVITLGGGTVFLVRVRKKKVSIKK